MSALIATYAFFSCVANLIVVGDTATPVAEKLAGGHSFWWVNRQVLILAGGFVGLPLMCLRDITSLRFSALLSFCAMFYIMIIVMQHGMDKVEEPDTGNTDGTVDVFVGSWSIFLALPNSCLSMQCQLQIPSIYSELRPELKTVRQMMGALCAAYGMMFTMYLTIAFFGYYTFRANTPRDIMEADYDKGSVDVLIGRACLSFVNICAMPMMHYPSRSALHTLWTSGHQPSDRTIGRAFFWTETLSFFILMLVMGLLIPNLGIVNDILGAIGGMMIIFIMPGLLFLKGRWSLGDAAIPEKWHTRAVIFVSIGIAMAAVCLGDLFANAFFHPMS
eukprot:gnl/TRDRNA2_/TRDRNA2_73505_c1_seq1.p1 gnl/TRDRNA2_/TRDRNA2_73505_c1~~gnl/TRDRNA2_/TRDRNA2_73505_c1_seq1.p1  ORF type:complete len:342 (+),score=27.59 gnl/TRDRNA2_/TRDRNA2_73505_c1_seq1:33-1028(+)